MQNPDKAAGESFGLIRFSINFYKAGDVAVDLEPQDPKLCNLAIMPEINIKKKNLLIYLFEGKDIISTDTFGGVDPFLEVEYGKTKLASKHINSNNNPIFKQVLKIPVIFPCLDKFIKLYLFDHVKDLYF